MAANLRQLAQQWERLGQEDPLWAILSEPERRGGRWNPEEFFQTGRHEVVHTIERIEAVAKLARGAALDFGCGVGRLTQALAEHFDEAHGVDISSSMVERAREYNRWGERCRYHHNPKTELALFEDCRFDFVLSAITLQHVQPRFAVGYLQEFARVLRPGGILFFHLPSSTSKDLRGMYYRLAPARLLSTLHRWKHGYEIYEMHSIPERKVTALLESSGLEVLDVSGDPYAGAGWIGQRYLARRRG